MNGRMYDPQNARMLSVDPVVNDGTDAQDYNKYSYARNNPLKYTDPSGYEISFNTGLGEVNFSWTQSSEIGSVDLNINKQFYDGKINEQDPGFSSIGDRGGLDAAYGSYDDKHNEQIDAIRSGDAYGYRITERTNDVFGAQTVRGLDDENMCLGTETETHYDRTRISLAGLGDGDPPGIGNSYRGREDAWMLARGGVISTADADATMGEKMIVLGSFATEVIGGIFSESINIALKFKFGKYLAKTKYANKNTVTIVESTNPVDKVVKQTRIDFKSQTMKPHFEKATQEFIKFPQKVKYLWNVGPNGAYNTIKSSTTYATWGDLLKLWIK